MKAELKVENFEVVGYTLIADNESEQEILKAISELHEFGAPGRQIVWDGTENEDKPSGMEIKFIRQDIQEKDHDGLSRSNNGLPLY